MKAVFTHAVRYDIQAVCHTPLRTGGAEGGTEDILRDGRGMPILQGPSISGAMRNWLEEQGETRLASQLFGSQSGVGQLMISEGEFADGTQLAQRPRLKIDGATRTAQHGHKFDMTHIATGSQLHWTVIWMGVGEDTAALEAVEKMLSAIHSGEISFGGQKSNGFGMLRLAVTKQQFDLCHDHDRNSWIENQWNGSPLKLSDHKSERWVQFTVTGEMDGVLVKSAKVTQQSMSSYTPNMTEGDWGIIPGSSVKGAVRSQVTTIAHYMGLKQQEVDRIFGRMSGEDDNGLAGQVRFEDVRLDRENRKKITRIRINRLTGGVIRGGLFSEEPLSSPVVLRILVPASEAQGCGLMVYALRDLAMGRYHLGSGAAIGRGIVKVGEITVTAPQNQTAKLKFTDGTILVTDEYGLLEMWTTAIGGVSCES